MILDMETVGWRALLSAYAEELDAESFTYLLSLVGESVTGLFSSYSAGELAQAVSQSFCSVLFGLAPMVCSLLGS
jgi:hypothetical protein